MMIYQDFWSNESLCYRMLLRLSTRISENLNLDFEVTLTFGFAATTLVLKNIGLSWTGT